METWLERHLDTFIANRVWADHAAAFRVFALARVLDDADYWLNVGWSSLYDQFLMEGNANENTHDSTFA